MARASRAMRVFFFNVAVVILIGIGLTGVEQAHWFLYVMPAFMLFAAASGLCPGMIMMQTLFGKD